MSMHPWHVQRGSSWLVSIKIQVWSRADVGLLKDHRKCVMLDPPRAILFDLCKATSTLRHYCALRVKSNLYLDVSCTHLKTIWCIHCFIVHVCSTIVLHDSWKLFTSQRTRGFQRCDLFLQVSSMLETGPSTMSRWEGTDSNYIISMVCCYWWFAATSIDVYLTNICCTPWNLFVVSNFLIKKSSEHENSDPFNQGVWMQCKYAHPRLWKTCFFLTKENMSKTKTGGFKYLLFSSLFGEDFQFDWYFSNGLKPPTRKNMFARRFSTKMATCLSISVCSPNLEHENTLNEF